MFVKSIAAFSPTAASCLSSTKAVESFHLGHNDVSPAHTQTASTFRKVSESPYHSRMSIRENEYSQPRQRAFTQWRDRLRPVGDVSRRVRSLLRLACDRSGSYVVLDATIGHTDGPFSVGRASVGIILPLIAVDRSPAGFIEYSARMPLPCSSTNRD